ncbi:GtrA family protein [Stenotrophomonas maltophilia]|uniref:GtrA family protein n=1 Tax=Stenotrophomonas maltophilia TaxID=40324 RepID=UPI001660BC6C
MNLRASLPTIARFLAGGVLNTGSTFVLYWLLLLVVEYRAAYAISFAAGILLSYLINTRFVFRTSHSLRKVILFPLVYLAGYFAGAIVLQFSVVHLGVDTRIAPLLSVCATLPLTYVLSKLILTWERRRSA